ncbi:hypothetical protein C479_04012 [Halovivax asiaticus JCM 14624]|uniref:Uncharacterized protein n=1 Tax=Halovivax asiaticus JCM 14624 TaxID=1227490 RepID=M0BS89_9EURY|nr:hypothetical protein C479_04012 [Halovivax asiaticus JCM 14624]
MINGANTTTRALSLLVGIAMTQVWLVCLILMTLQREAQVGILPLVEIHGSSSSIDSLTKLRLAIS